MAEMANTPNPGSDEAIDLGCKCPVLDNAHGCGYRGRADVFVINALCAVHGERYRKAMTEAENFAQ